MSDQRGILRTWPQKGPEVLWTVNVGIGFGGPVVIDAKVYLLDRDDKGGSILAEGLLLSTDGFKCWWSNPELGAPGTCQWQASDKGSEPVVVRQSYQMISVRGRDIQRE